MHLIGPTLDRCNRIDHTQTPILVTVPIEAYAATLLFNNALHKSHHSARAVWCRMSDSVANANRLRTRSNSGSVECAYCLRLCPGRIFSDIHNQESLRHGERHGVF